MAGLGRALKPFAARISMMLARGVIQRVGDGTKIQTVQATFMANEVRDNLQRYQEYGFTSVPHPGAGAIAAFLGGNRDHGIVIAVDDRRYRLTGLAGGEVALHDDLGHKVHLTRSGIVIDGAGHDILIQNTPKVRIDSMLEVTGDIKDNCDSQPDTIAEMRAKYNAHVHPENDSGGPTDTPSNTMGV